MNTINRALYAVTKIQNKTVIFSRFIALFDMLKALIRSNLIALFDMLKALIRSHQIARFDKLKALIRSHLNAHFELFYDVAYISWHSGWLIYYRYIDNAVSIYKRVERV